MRPVDSPLSSSHLDWTSIPPIVLPVLLPLKPASMA